MSKEVSYDPSDGEFVDFATLDDWRERDEAKNALIEYFERQIAAADKLAAYVEHQAKLNSIAFGTDHTDAWKEQSPYAAELLTAYRASKGDAS